MTPYTPEFSEFAAEFTRHQFGVDPAKVDWREAVKHRIISASFAHTAPFDPVAACSAARLAALSVRTQKAAPEPPQAPTQGHRTARTPPHRHTRTTQQRRTRNQARRCSLLSLTTPSPVGQGF